MNLGVFCHMPASNSNSVPIIQEETVRDLLLCFYMPNGIEGTVEMPSEPLSIILWLTREVPVDWKGALLSGSAQEHM